MRLRLLSPIMALLLLCLACSVLGSLQRAGQASEFTRPGGAATPQEAVRRGLCGEDDPSEFRVYDVRQMTQRYGQEGPERWATVVYRGVCPPRGVGAQGEEYVGVVDVRRYWFSWELLGGYLGDRFAGVGGPGRFVTLGSHGNGQTMDGAWYASVTGRVVAPDRVTAVEVSFDNGRSVRREVDGRAFILVGWGARNPCELRAIGDGGRVLERIPLDPVEGPGPGPARGCPRSSD